MEGKRTRIMAFGTFDGLHEGHMDFFRQARSLSSSPFLIISIARDRNVIKIKGKRPILSEEERADLVRKSGMADKVVLGGMDDHLSHILEEKPDVIALGYDQESYVENLEEDLRRKNLEVVIFRLEPHKENIFKNHLLKSHGKQSH